MGSCACISKVTRPSIIPIPDFEYFHQEDGMLIEIKQNIPQTRSLGSFFSADSAILLSGKQLLVVGGGYPDYSSDVSLIDTDSRTLQVRSPLPVRSRLGQLYEFECWVYYVGGLTPHRWKGKEEPSPLMRYNLHSDDWEILNVNIEAIAYPGTFVFGTKLYMVGGIRRDSKRRIKRNKAVFSIDLAHPQNLIPEEGQLPLEMLSPHCVVRGSTAIIAGGKTSDEVPLRKAFIYDLKKPRGFQEFPDLPVNLTRHHPPCCDEHCALFFAYPKALALFGDDKWQVIDISFRVGYFTKNSSTVKSPSQGESLNRCVTISTVLETTGPKVMYEEVKDKSESINGDQELQSMTKDNIESIEESDIDFSPDSDPEIIITERTKCEAFKSSVLSVNNERESAGEHRYAPSTWSFSSGSGSSSLEIKEIPIMVDPFTFEEDFDTGNAESKIMISGTIDGYWNLKNTKTLLGIIGDNLGIHTTQNLSLLKEWDFEASLSAKVISDVIASMLKEETYSFQKIETALRNIYQEFGGDLPSAVLKRHQVSSENLVLYKKTVLKMLKTSLESIDFIV